MRQLKQFKTKKLHYGRYLYKIVLHNQLANIFRTEMQPAGDLKYAKVQLDDLQQQYDKGEPLYRVNFRTKTPVSADDFLDAKDLYSVLRNNDSYTVRVEKFWSVSIYTNDKDMLVNIASKMRDSAREFWEPDSKDKDLLTQTPNIIIVESKPIFEYKVTFNAKISDPNFANWAKSNQDKCKIGPVTLDNIQNKLYNNGSYFFVRDEKVLNLVRLMVGHNIRRVDKLVYKG